LSAEVAEELGVVDDATESEDAAGLKMHYKYLKNHGNDDDECKPEQRY
jgi:hypothetical protein